MGFLVAVAMFGVFFVCWRSNNRNRRLAFGWTARIGASSFSRCLSGRFFCWFFSAHRIASGFFGRTLGVITGFNIGYARSFFSLTALNSSATLLLNTIGERDAMRMHICSSSSIMHGRFNFWYCSYDRFRRMHNLSDYRFRCHCNVRLKIGFVFCNGGFAHFVLTLNVGAFFTHFNIYRFTCITRTGFDGRGSFALQSDFFRFQRGFAMAALQKIEQALFLIVRNFRLGAFVLQTSFVHLLKQTLDWCAY